MEQISPEELKKKWELPGNHLFVVYENHNPPNIYNSLGLIPGWGLSVAIKFKGKNILFDCGWSDSIELNNLSKLSIPDNIFDYIIISHQHWDHMGGLAAIIDRNPEATIYLPDDFSNRLTDELKKKGHKVFRLKGINGPLKLLDGFYITGDALHENIIGEQGIIIKCEKYNLLICGCLHPGLKPLYSLASKSLEPNAILGGIHGFKDLEFLRSTKIRNLFLGHCTEHLELFKKLPNFIGQQIFPGFYLEL